MKHEPISDHRSTVDLQNSRRWPRMSASSVAFTFVLSGILLLCYANRPLWHTDLWDHVNYGRKMLQTGALPTTEPLVPLAAGAPMVNTAWGAQVFMAAVLSSTCLGLPALQFGHGLLVVIGLAAVGQAVRKNSGSTLGAVIAVGAMLAVNWQQFLVIRPQIVGVTFYSVVLALLATDQLRRRWVRCMVPLLFVAWANLHGSFAMGLTLMGVWAAGQAVKAWWTSKSVHAALRCDAVQRLLWLIPVCAAAALLPPNGISVYLEIFRIGGLQNIQSMYEWAPLTLSMKQGKATLIVVGLLVLATVFSPKRLRLELMLSLIVFGGLAVWSSRMLNWFGPVVAVALGLQAASAWQRWRFRAPDSTGKAAKSPDRRAFFTAANVGICFLAFFFSNLGVQTLGGSALAPTKLLSSRTPITMVEFLNSKALAPRNPVFVPAEWAGYVFYATDGRVMPFVNLHVHVMPEQLWSDYMHIMLGQRRAIELLNNYDVDLVVTDRLRNRYLIERLLAANEFRLRYKDSQAVVFQRTGTTLDAD